MIKSMSNFHNETERIVVANKFWGKDVLARIVLPRLWTQKSFISTLC